jgi:alkaline phosphatase D
MEYWPVRQDAAEPHRVYRALRWGSAAELFVLDTRQYRDETTGTILGAAQMRWLLDALAKSDARFKFICTSVPISGPNRDKWGGFPEDRDRLLGTIAKQKIRGVIFLSSDVHYAAVARVGNMKEIITGPLGAPFGKGNPNEKRFEYFNKQQFNYGLVNVRGSGAQPHVEIEILGEKNALLYKLRVDAD